MRPRRLPAVLLYAARSAGVRRAQSATEVGIDVVDVVRATGTVQNVDLENRTVTLRLDDGKPKTIKVDKSVQNLHQVKVGDRLELAYAEETIMAIGKTVESESEGVSGCGLVSVAPKGAKPILLDVETVAMTGKILAVDTAKYRVTLQEPDGQKMTVKASKKIKNLGRLKVGDIVDVSVTEAIAIEVVK
jgi:translation initiation factor IF-1